MTYRRWLLGSALLLALLPLALRADVPPPVAETIKRLDKDLRELCSDRFEGRGVMTKGINLAAEHIEREFIQAGLKPGGPGKSCFQPFQLVLGFKAGPNNALILKGPDGKERNLSYGEQFTVWPLGVMGKVEAPLVFAGHGLTSEPDKYDDYAGLDVEGKVAVILLGAPRQLPGLANVSVQSRVELAKKHKAVAVLLLNHWTTVAKTKDQLPRAKVSVQYGTSPALPGAFVRRTALAEAFTDSGPPLEETEGMAQPFGVPKPRLLKGWSCRLQTEGTLSQVPVKNVIGVAEGSGPLAKETVVIGAHYDHIGYGVGNRFAGIGEAVMGPGSPGGVGFPVAELAPSAIHYGADDNASSTAVLLELARRFGPLKERKGRRLVFVAFTAEEVGLIGSQYYCEHPAFPLADTAAMLNMDQIGRLQDDKLMIGGTGSAAGFEALADRLAAKHKFVLSKDPSGEGPSDHQPFFFKKTPVFWLFTGFHENYHRPTDRVETLNIPGLARIVNLAVDLGTELTTMPRPTYAKTPTFDRTRTLWTEVAATGIVLDARAERPTVAGLVPGLPGEKAGLRKGDHILSIADQRLASPLAFCEAVRKLTPGSKVAITYHSEAGGDIRKGELVLPPAPPGMPDRAFGFVGDFADLKNGVLVLEIPKGSPAERAGLKKGDRLVAIDGVEFPDVKTYQAFIRALAPAEPVRLTIVRAGERLELPARAVGEEGKP